MDWYTDSALTTLYNFDSIVSIGFSLYAGWIPNTASVTLTVAQIENGDPAFSAPIVVSRNGLGTPSVFNVNVANAGNYSHFKWEIAGVGLMPSHVVEGASASTFTINAANPNYATLGGHVLKLTVTRNGILYQVNIPFTIIEIKAPVEVNANGVTTGYANLAAAFTAIGTQAGNFIITLRENQTNTTGRTISANQHITIVGEGAQRTINGSTIASAATMFTISNANSSFTLGNNVTIQGRTNVGNGPVVNNTNGTFRMLAGSKITGHTSSSGTSAAVTITGTSSIFEMSGGSIDGNNNTTAATTTTATGGVYFFDGTFTMTGGSISGNTQGTDPSDVYHAVTTANRFTMSGNAAIGALKLNAANATVAASVNIGDGWTGSINRLNLRSGIAAIATVVEWWDYKMIFSGISSAKINSITLGDFIGSGNARQEIGELCYIGTSGNELGRLMVKPAAAVVTVTANSATSGYLSIAGAFAAIGTQTGSYTVTLLQDVPINGNILISTADQNVTITGEGAVRTINGSSIGTGTTMFTIYNATASLTLGNNVTIQGRTNAGTTAVINNMNGTFRMLAGSKITGHTSNSGISAAVNITGTSSVFEMSGGSIDGNNNTTAATTTTATGGVYFTNGTFTMSGGSITGNTQDAQASDVYHAVTTANRFTMSGNAAIGALKLNATSATAAASVNIGAGWTGSINRLNLRGNIAAIETALEWWTDKLIFSGINASKVTDIGLGDFVGSSGAVQPINPAVLGTSGDNLGRLLVPPIHITTEEELRMVGTGQIHNGRAWSLTAQYLLMNNITLTGNWTRIGGATTATAFAGTFDGNGHTITGMTINDNTNNQGMFGYVHLNGVVKNLRLADINITSGGINVGGIAGQNAGLILNCRVSGIINSTNTVANNETTSSNVGGIVGWNGQAGSGVFTVQGCSADVTITAAGGNIGGIVGCNSQVIRNCYSTGSIISTSTSTNANIGGITGASNIGNFSNVIIAGCYSAMSITANGGNVGGMVGNSLFGTNLNNNLTLNEFITTSASAATIGRISGNTGGTRINNRAWQDMPVSSGGTYTRTATLTGKDGLDVTTAELKTQNPWTESVFPFGNNDASPWVWQDGKMPRLYWETSARDWPAYLTD